MPSAIQDKKLLYVRNKAVKRFTDKELEVKRSYEAYNIPMLTWNELRYAKMEDVNDLYSIMKEIVSLKSKEAELIAKKYLTTEEIEDNKEEINTELLEYLQSNTKGTKAPH